MGQAIDSSIPLARASLAQNRLPTKLRTVLGLRKTATVTVDVAEAAALPGGLVLQLDAGTGVTTDGTDLVTGWVDQSGQAMTSAASATPRLVARCPEWSRCHSSRWRWR